MNESECRRRLAVAEASDRLLRREIKRADFLRLCARAGFGLAGLGLWGQHPHAVRAAQGATVEYSAGPRSASDPGTDQYRFLKEMGHAFAGTSLHVLSEETPPSKATRELLLREFIPVTGLDVTWELLPLDRVLARAAADTARQAGTHDLIYFDHSWVGRFADDTVPVEELLAKSDLAYPDYQYDDILQTVIEHVASYKQRVVGIPYDIPVQVVLYRSDIFGRLGLSLPQTLPDLLTVIRSIHEEMQPEVFGITGMWKSGHYALLVEACPWLWSHGGSFFAADGQPTINDDAAHEAMAYMMELGRYMPPEAITWDWSAAAKSMAQGRAAIFINSGEWMPLLDDPLQSEVVGLIQAAPCPKELALRPKSACGFDETPGISRQGGAYLGISKHSQNIDAAWVLLQWATSADVTLRAGLVGGGSNLVRLSNFSDPRIEASVQSGFGTSRHFPVTLDAIMNRMGTEPHLHAWPTLSVDHFAVELGKMTTGQQGIEATLAQMARQAESAVQEERRRMQ